MPPTAPAVAVAPVKKIMMKVVMRCYYGASMASPTSIWSLPALEVPEEALHCNHPMQEWTRPGDVKVYVRPHQPSSNSGWACNGVTVADAKPDIELPLAMEEWLFYQANAMKASPMSKGTMHTRIPQSACGNRSVMDPGPVVR